MKLLYVAERAPPLSQTFVRDEMSFFLSRGHSVHLICKNHLPAAEDSLISTNFYDRLWIISSPSKFKILIWKIGQKLRRPRSVAPSYVGRAMASHLKKINFLPDALIAHFGPNVLLACDLKRYMGKKIPLIGVFHGYDLSKVVKTQGFESYEQKSDYIDLFVPISNHWNNTLRSFGIAPEKIRMIRLGVDMDTIPKRSSSCDRARFTIVSVGRLVEKKGFDTLIDAFSRLPEPLLEKSELLIIGDGPLREPLQLRAAAGKGRNNLRFLGALSHSEVLKYISGASAFVLASRTAADGDMEGIPIVLMEAMAAGTPVIASHHSGIPELIEDEVTGLLVPESDSAALTEALRAIMDDPVAAEQRLRAARRQIEVRFNRPIQTRILEAEILRLVAGA